MVSSIQIKEDENKIRNNEMSANKVAFYAALCLFLSAIEYAIPKPLPFLRLGLANLPLILSLKKFNSKEYFLLALLKILGQAFISGTLFSYIFLFSLSGTLASAVGMFFIYKIAGRFLSCIGISLLGSFLNVNAQLLCARYIMFGENVKYICPFLLIAGFITGLILGIFSNIFEDKSEWYKDNFVFFEKKENNFSEYKNEKYLKIIFCISLLVMAFFLFIKNLMIIWICLGIFLLALEIKKKGKVKLLPSFFIVIFITIFALLSPNGKVLFCIGKFRVTQGALFSGLARSGKLVGMVFISQFAIDRRLSFKGKGGKLIEKIFMYFDRLTSRKISFKKGQIVSSIDKHLMEISH